MPTDRPSQNELVNAVREFLENKIAPELDGYLGFNTRVAINTLKIIERELELGPKINADAKQRLLTLLKSSDQEQSFKQLNQSLVKKINDGNLSYDNDELMDHLWTTTMDKLSIDNPRYSTYTKKL